jgi:SAM-dependent methyltransferase
MKRKLKEHHAPPPAGQLHEYASETYWQNRYNSLTDDACIEFEWLHSYEVIQPLFRYLVKLDANVLDVGCGTSRLVADLRADGYRGRVVAIDYTRAAIERLQKLLGGAEALAKDAIELLEMDARAMRFKENSFGAVLDKVLDRPVFLFLLIFFPELALHPCGGHP